MAEMSPDDGSLIEVLVVYTGAARGAAGGTTAMNTLINLAVSETNTGYGNSGVVQRIRLVQAEGASSSLPVSHARMAGSSR